jgi:methionyl-tRNA formyltransferase
VPALARLLERTEVVGVVTQPDRPAGRGHKLTPTPVKAFAREHGLALFEPLKLRAFASELVQLAPDILVVASYGRIVPQAILDVPASGLAFNIHPSLLPLYRGATPLQSALRDGATETGVTIIAMDAGMDTGDILIQERTPLGPEETYGMLHDRLAERGAALVIDAIDALERGTLARIPQSDVAEPAAEIDRTATRPLEKDDLRVDFTWPAKRIVDTIRSLAPAPGARATLDGEAVKILRARPAQPGEPALTADGGLLVSAGDGTSVAVLELVPPNRGRMSGAAYARSGQPA